MATYTNRLAQETSPYLLQHAHNPVDWFPWSDEAFQKAKEENKPVLVSIGYAACHWCHVMERESFEDPEVAAIMNANFINIKVDREERPDVDHIYMDAVQAISGSGGWPLNVFLTPEGKPFYGGTYFPPRRAFNRASWTEVLQAIVNSYKENHEKVTADAEMLTAHLQSANSFEKVNPANDPFHPHRLDDAFQNIMKMADKEWGGFGKAPKFPQTFTILFLLRYGFQHQNSEALNQALLSLDKMMQGGLYDHVGGGFARYSTDTEWLAPHFEKMLYDNALLVTAYAEAYQITNDKRYEELIKETLTFIEREMLHKDGGFYSALDADSEGEEGKFYVWSYAEVQSLLHEDADLFCQYFDVSENGNWEGKNILFVKTPLSQFAKEKDVSAKHLEAIIKNGKEKLLQARSRRVRPALDDKILLGWNALMNAAYSRAYAALGIPHYLDVAERNMAFLLHNFTAENGLFHHTWKEGKAKHPAFLDDYSYVITSLIELCQITNNHHYFKKAEEITEIVLAGFSDSESPLFFYTHTSQKDILLRKKEIYDGATPSGNATMAINLHQLAILLDKPSYRSRSENMIVLFTDVAVKYPTSFGIWLSLLQQNIYGTAEIAIVGKESFKLQQEVFRTYITYKLLMIAEQSNPEYPMLRDKDSGVETLIYLCQNYACQQPVKTMAELKKLLASK